jgi:hypothetical protein
VAAADVSPRLQAVTDKTRVVATKARNAVISFNSDSQASEVCSRAAGVHLPCHAVSCGLSREVLRNEHFDCGFIAA